MTNSEIEMMVEKLFNRFQNIPGVDKSFIRKCLQGISSLNDSEVESKIRLFSHFI